MWDVPGYYDTPEGDYRKYNFDEEGNIKDPIRKQTLELCVIKDDTKKSKTFIFFIHFTKTLRDYITLFTKNNQKLSSV